MVAYIVTLRPVHGLAITRWAYMPDCQRGIVDELNGISGVRHGELVQVRFLSWRSARRWLRFDAPFWGWIVEDMHVVGTPTPRQQCQLDADERFSEVLAKRKVQGR